MPDAEAFKWMHHIWPKGLHLVTKMMLAKIMAWADKADGIKYTALRYFNVAGASSDGSIGEDHAPETHLIPNILKSAISGDGKFTIFGDDYNTKDGTNVRDYVQVEDLIDAVVPTNLCV